MLIRSHSTTPPSPRSIVIVPPPVRLPPLGLKPIEGVTSPVYVRSWLPDASNTVTRTACCIGCPACVMTGSSVNSRQGPGAGGGGEGGAPHVTTKSPRPVPAAGTFTVSGFALVTVQVAGTPPSPTTWSPAATPVIVRLTLVPMDPAALPSTVSVYPLGRSTPLVAVVIARSPGWGGGGPGGLTLNGALSATGAAVPNAAARV